MENYLKSGYTEFGEKRERETPFTIETSFHDVLMYYGNKEGYIEDLDITQNDDINILTAIIGTNNLFTYMDLVDDYTTDGEMNRAGYIISQYIIDQWHNNTLVNTRK